MSQSIFDGERTRMTGTAIDSRRCQVTMWICACFALVTAGCSVGPSYKEPGIPVGEGWTVSASPVSASPVSASPVSASPEVFDVSWEWWQQFEDPVLTELVNAANQQNLSIAQAGARVAEARAIRAAAGSGLWPALSGRGSRTRQRSSENVPSVASLGAGSAYQTVYDVGLDSVWELDLFGKTRRRIESANATYHAAIELERDVRVAIKAETALTYFELRGAQLQLAAERASYDAAEQNRVLIERRLQVGRASLADLHRADADVKQIDARLPGLEATRDVAARRLSVLLGELPESRVALAADAATFPSLAKVPVGTRSDLLRRRPDVRASERLLAAATADIGVAKGEYFPSLSLVSSAGFTSLDLGTLVKAASRTLSVLPLVRWRVFDRGRIRAEVEAAGARAEQAAYAYEATVLTAISEVEQALIRYHGRLGAVERQAAAVTATEDGLALIDKQYRAGRVSLLILLDAQRQLSTARSQLARTQTNAALDLVALYKTLGGGWERLSEAPLEGDLLGEGPNSAEGDFQAQTTP